MELAIIMLLCFKKLFLMARFILRSLMISFRLNKNAKKISGIPAFFYNHYRNSGVNLTSGHFRTCKLYSPDS